MARTQNLFALFVALTAIVLLGVMEIVGLLLYIGYPAVAVLCILLALVLAAVSVYLEHEGKRSRYANLVACAVLSILGPTVGRFSTSPRKHFYVLSTGIKRGQSLDSVKAQFASYESWISPDSGDDCCHISFRYTEPSTMDVVVVHYDPKTNRVLDADYSHD